mmetsp:Transcript_66020/g.157861  ORF Transcript_66020/g.157861 Transcript_66020/m.157861 type:complete len:367 (+) Transcript_66020:169-1269(+)
MSMACCTSTHSTSATTPAAASPYGSVKEPIADDNISSSSSCPAHIRAGLTNRLADDFEDQNVANDLLDMMLEQEQQWLQSSARERKQLNSPTASGYSTSRAHALSFLWHSPLRTRLNHGLKFRTSQILDMTSRLVPDSSLDATLTVTTAALLLAAKVEPGTLSPTTEDMASVRVVADQACAGAKVDCLSLQKIAEEEGALFQLVQLALGAPAVPDWIEIFATRFVVVLKNHTPVTSEDVDRIMKRAQTLAADMVWLVPMSATHPPYHIALGCFIISLIFEGVLSKACLSLDREACLRLDRILAMVRMREDTGCWSIFPDVGTFQPSWGWTRPPKLLLLALLIGAGCDEHTVTFALKKVTEVLDGRR